MIGAIRTDLDAFSEVEQGVLVNHGYAVIDAAVRTHWSGSIVAEVPFAWPIPASAPACLPENELRGQLTGSAGRKMVGRRY